MRERDRVDGAGGGSGSGDSAGGGFDDGGSSSGGPDGGGSGSDEPAGGTAPNDAAPSLAALEAAIERAETVAERIDREGADLVEAGADAYRTATQLLEHYEDSATGTGRSNFAAYVRLESQFAGLVEGLAEDLSERAAFEAARDAIDKRRLTAEDFDRARRELEPAERYVDLLDEREAAADELGDARSAASRRVAALEAEIERLEELQAMGSVDLDAPVDRLRDPIATYNEAVREAFEAFLSSASAREVFAFLDRSRWYPLVAFDPPPADLREFVETSDAGSSTVPRLLEYAAYSRSKLAHHVDDADRLKRNVATRRTALERLDADPLTVAWPPPDAETLRYRIRELRPLVARIADEETVVALRDVRTLTRDPEFERLRTAARAAAELDADDRRRLRDGRVAADLEATKAERDRLAAALERASQVW